MYLYRAAAQPGKFRKIIGVVLQQCCRQNPPLHSRPIFESLATMESLIASPPELWQSADLGGDNSSIEGSREWEQKGSSLSDESVQWEKRYAQNDGTSAEQDDMLFLSASSQVSTLTLTDSMPGSRVRQEHDLPQHDLPQLPPSSSAAQPAAGRQDSVASCYRCPECTSEFCKWSACRSHEARDQYSHAENVSLSSSVVFSDCMCTEKAVATSIEGLKGLETRCRVAAVHGGEGELPETVLATLANAYFQSPQNAANWLAVATATPRSTHPSTTANTPAHSPSQPASPHTSQPQEVASITTRDAKWYAIRY